MHLRALIGAALAAAFALCLAVPATAQVAQIQAIVIPTCGSVTLPAGDPRTPYMDLAGRWCTSATAASTPGAQEQDVRSSGTLNAATINAAINIPTNGQGTVGLAFTGLTASGATITYEQSIDGGTTWTGVNEVNAGTGAFSPTRTTDGQVRVSVSGRSNLRLRVSGAGTGTIGVAWTVSVREGFVTLASPLPPGANIVGGAYGASTALVVSPAPTVARGATSLIAKTAAANLYGFSFTQGTTAGFFAVLDAAAAPAPGAAIAPVECIPVAANAGLRARHDIPDRYLSGIVAVSTSSCTTFTAVTPLLISVVAQ